MTSEEFAPRLRPVPESELLTGRVIDVVIWGASRPDLFRRTIESFRENARFTGWLRYFLEDGDFHPALAIESAEIARSLGFDGINVERVKSYGWAMTRAMDRWVRAPFMFSLEDDWLCKRPIDFDLAWALFEEHAHVNQLRFNRRKNTRDQNEGQHVYAQRTLSIGGQPYPFLSSPHWMFNPALWRMDYVRPRWRGAKDNVHLYVNGPGHVFLPAGPRPSSDWYADTLGALTWGGVGEPGYFEHIGGGERSIHKTQGRV